MKRIIGSVYTCVLDEKWSSSKKNELGGMVCYVTHLLEEHCQSFLSHLRGNIRYVKELVGLLFEIGNHFLIILYFANRRLCCITFTYLYNLKQVIFKWSHSIYIYLNNSYMWFVSTIYKLTFLRLDVEGFFGFHVPTLF